MDHHGAVCLYKVVFDLQDSGQIHSLPLILLFGSILSGRD